jgi:hypothetical protein
MARMQSTRVLTKFFIRESDSVPVAGLCQTPVQRIMAIPEALYKIERHLILLPPSVGRFQKLALPGSSKEA